MEKVREKMEKTKTECACARKIEEEKKISQEEIKRLCQELEKINKRIIYQKMSKSEAHEELLKLQENNEVSAMCTFVQL